MKAVAIIGSYRKGHITHQAVEVVLAYLRENDFQTEQIDLNEKRIEFCQNCRKCAQPPGRSRQECRHDDDMDNILAKLDTSDVIILASPVNFFSVTAIIKRFIERMLVYVYWPWGSAIPKPRIDKPTKQALIITSSAAPAWLARLMMRHPGTILKRAAVLAGSKMVKWVHLGTVAMAEDKRLTKKQQLKLRQAAYRLTKSDR